MKWLNLVFLNRFVQYSHCLPSENQRLPGVFRVFRGGGEGVNEKIDQKWYWPCY